MIQSQTGSRFRFQKALSLGPRDPKACQHTSWDIPELEIPKICQFLEEIGSHCSQSPGGRNLIYEASIFGCSGTKLAAKFMGIQGNSPQNATLTQETAGLIKRLFTTMWGGVPFPLRVGAIWMSDHCNIGFTTLESPLKGFKISIEWWN